MMVVHDPIRIRQALPIHPSCSGKQNFVEALSHSITSWSCCISAFLVALWRSQFDYHTSREWREDVFDSACGICVDSRGLCARTQRYSHLLNTYKDALQDLHIMHVAQLSMSKLAQVMAFKGRLGGHFTQLLAGRHSRALLIMCKWISMLDLLDLWWIKLLR